MRQYGYDTDAFNRVAELALYGAITKDTYLTQTLASYSSVAQRKIRVIHVPKWDNALDTNRLAHDLVGYSEEMLQKGWYVKLGNKIIDSDDYDTTYYAPTAWFSKGLGYREKIDRDLYRVHEDILLNKPDMVKTMQMRNASLNVALGLVSYSLLFKSIGATFGMLLYHVDLYHEVYIDMCSKISTYIKQSSNHYLRTVWLELNALGGFFNNTTYNPLPDIHALVDYREYYRGSLTLSRYWEILMSFPVTARKRKTFMEWLSTGEYTTSGASSIAYVDAILNGEEVDFKGKKSWLPIVFEAHQLYHMCKQATSFKCKTGLKPELGKIRFFVGFDDLGYLIQSYILYLMNKWYVGYQGITLDQSVSQAFIRDKSIVSALSTQWAMPFDYKQFDHQITKIEVELICKRIVDVVANYLDPIDYWMKDKFMQTVTNAYLEYKGDKISYDNGLLSGMRITSLVGNLWNLIMSTHASRDLVVTKYILGDDTLYLADHRETLQTILNNMDDQRVDYSLEKFSISKGYGDFLRNTYTSTIIYGLPTRSLASTISRKPWNADPLDPFDKVKNIIDGLGTTFRRLGIYYDDKLVRKFLAGQKYISYLGGVTSLGSLAGMRNYVSSQSYDYKPEISLQTFTSNTYLNIIYNNFKEYLLSYEDVNAIAKIQQKSLLSTDNLSRVKIPIKSSTNNVYIKPLSYDFYVNTIVNNSQQLKNTKTSNFFSTTTPSDNYKSSLYARLSVLHSIGYFKTSVFKAFVDFYPIIGSMERQLSHRGARRQECLSLLVDYNLPIIFTFPKKMIQLTLGSLYDMSNVPDDLTNHSLYDYSMTISILTLFTSYTNYFMN